MNIYSLKTLLKSDCCGAAMKLVLLIFLWQGFALTTLYGIEPVDAQFLGKWSFDHAQIQERVVGTPDYKTRTVAQDEFWKNHYLLSTPTEMTFHEDFGVRISHPSWSFNALAVMNNGKLEFRNYIEDFEVDFDKQPDLEAIDNYPVMGNPYNLTFSGKLLQMQCAYSYLNNKGEEMEAILTIFYN